MAQTDSFGDRLKAYEALDTSRKAFKGQPIIARLDGRAFHTFTQGLKRPFDERLTRLMIDTTKHLVDRFGAAAGYCQYDEITLAWFVDSSSQSEYVFDGRFQKMDSLLAASASVYFNRQLDFYLPEKAALELMPIFDCRAFVVPNLLEAYHCFLWRQQDCTMNAISTAAQSMFSHKSLQGMSGPQMIERMHEERKVVFDFLDDRFRLGTFARRTKVLMPMAPEVVEKLHLLGKPVDSTKLVERSVIETCSVPLRDLEDPIGFLFKGGSAATKALDP